MSWQVKPGEPGYEAYEAWLLTLPECEHCDGLGLVDAGNDSRQCALCSGTGRVLPEGCESTAPAME